ncbi:putative MLX-interacting protein isoform X3, partial [Apostichopus japonicus]
MLHLSGKVSFVDCIRSYCRSLQILQYGKDPSIKVIVWVVKHQSSFPDSSFAGGLDVFYTLHSSLEETIFVPLLLPLLDNEYKAPTDCYCGWRKKQSSSKNLNLLVSQGIKITRQLCSNMNSVNAVVLEGKYGKRTTTAVIGEYQKWRTFYMKPQKKDLMDGESMDWSQITSLSDRDFYSVTGQVPMVLDEDTLLSEFSDTLFSSLNQSFIFPNPREF